MATSLDAYIDLLVKWVYDDDTIELADSTNRGYHRSTYDMDDGTGSLQANLLFIDRRRLTPSSPTDLLDLAGGLTDVFGNTLTFSVIKALKIHNRGVPNASPATVWTPTTGEDIEVGGGANPITSIWGGASATGLEKLIVRSGGAFALSAAYDGYVVTAGSADVLRVSLEGSGSYDVDYDIMILGN